MSGNKMQPSALKQDDLNAVRVIKEPMNEAERKLKEERDYVQRLRKVFVQVKTEIIIYTLVRIEILKEQVADEQARADYSAMLDDFQQQLDSTRQEEMDDAERKESEEREQEIRADIASAAEPLEQIAAKLEENLIKLAELSEQITERLDHLLAQSAEYEAQAEKFEAKAAEHVEKATFYRAEVEKVSEQLYKMLDDVKDSDARNVVTKGDIKIHPADEVKGYVESAKAVANQSKEQLENRGALLAAISKRRTKATAKGVGKNEKLSPHDMAEASAQKTPEGKKKDAALARIESNLEMARQAARDLPLGVSELVDDLKQNMLKAFDHDRSASLFSMRAQDMQYTKSQYVSMLQDFMGVMRKHIHRESMKQMREATQRQLELYSDKEKAGGKLTADERVMVDKLKAFQGLSRLQDINLENLNPQELKDWNKSVKVVLLALRGKTPSTPAAPTTTPTPVKGADTKLSIDSQDGPGIGVDSGA